jgi:predicted kinase
MSFGPNVVPIPGATRVETAQSLARALELRLGADNRAALDALFSGRLLRVPRAQRRPRESSGDVVMVMGMPGAGKSSVARELESQGYQRLNRDSAGGSLAGLVPRLEELLASGEQRVVLDNTYPTRASRNEVVEAAWRRGAEVRCIWLTTSVADAQINAIRRMLDAHGSLPSPDEIKQRGRTDTRYLLPDAQFRYERTVEPPTPDEGFASIEARAFVREPEPGDARALILDFDDISGDCGSLAQPAPNNNYRSLASLGMTGEGLGMTADKPGMTDARREVLLRYHRDGWLLFAHAWRPRVERGETTLAEVEACFEALRQSLGVPIDIACCPHDAGPPACWCRKPIPGSFIEFARRRDVVLSRSLVVGSGAADRTVSDRIGTRHETSESFWRSG